MRIIITEQQLVNLTEIQILKESIFEASSIDEFKQEVRKLIRKMLLMGIATASIIGVISNMCDKKGVSPEFKQEAIATAQQEVKSPVDKNWKLADTHTIVTVYNAVPAQCNNDFGHTASMFRLNLYNVLSHRIIAMERTYMKKLGLNYGDVVKIEGTNGYDGVWQIQDTMNKRFAGQNKIDILVPDNIKYGQWDNVKLYVLKNPALASKYASNFAPQVSREENKKMMAQKRAEMKAKNKKNNTKKKSIKK